MKYLFELEESNTITINFESGGMVLHLNETSCYLNERELFKFIGACLNIQKEVKEDNKQIKIELKRK